MRVVQLIIKKGNPDTHIILRGGAHGPNYDEINIASYNDMLNKSNLHNTGIIVDCSHGNSKDLSESIPCSI